MCLYKIISSYSHDLESLVHSGELQFFEIKLLSRTFRGNPVVEILIDEANSSFMSCVAELLKVQKKERLARENYEESFRATNCHELRTPVQNQQQLVR